MPENVLVAAALAELGDLMDALDTLGADYARRYVEYLARPDGGPPNRPPGLHVDLAHAIRDVVMDRALAFGTRLPVAAR
jgi:hypothetical protein